MKDSMMNIVNCNTRSFLSLSDYKTWRPTEKNHYFVGMFGNN